MSYQVLARKWRPKSFREMVGQEHVLRALINALDHNRLHHAYLFTGTRGVGKTTIARILARCFTCETGISSEPCGECSACVEIGEGRMVDLIEVDAASRTKVEDTRELLDNVQYAPTRARFKIYLIDEVHMLSNHSFNALLKTLEEPPEHVKFLLATTDPQKLPVTILSRCLQFNLKNMSPERIVSYLQEILAKEAIVHDDPALWLLARAADGSMRDALSLTDQAIAFGNGKVSEGDVSSMLGTIDHRLIQKLIMGLINENPSEILALVASFSEHAPDYSAALAELLSILHRVAIAQAAPEALDNSLGDREQILEFAQNIAPENVQLYYQTALVGRRDLPLASDARSGFEMTLLRMLAFKPQGVVDIPSRRLGGHNQTGQNQEGTTPASPVGEVAGDAVKKPIANSAPTSSAKVQTTSEATAVPRQQSAASPSSTTQENRPAQSVPQAEPAIRAEHAPQAGLQPTPEAEPQPSQASVSEPRRSANYASVEGIKPAAEGSEVQQQGSAESEEYRAVEPSQTEPASKTSVPSETAPVKTESSPPARSGAEDTKAFLREQVKAIAGSEGFTEKPKPKPKAIEPSKIEPSKTVVIDEKKVALDEFEPLMWVKVYKQLGIKGILQSTAANCVLLGREQNHLSFAMDEAKATLFDSSHVSRLEGLLSDYFEQPIKLQMNLIALDGALETPSTYIAREKQEMHAAVMLGLAADPVVQTLQNEFDASLVEESVKTS